MRRFRRSALACKRESNSVLPGSRVLIELVNDIVRPKSACKRARSALAPARGQDILVPVWA